MTAKDAGRLSEFNPKKLQLTQPLIDIISRFCEKDPIHIKRDPVDSVGGWDWDEIFPAMREAFMRAIASMQCSEHLRRLPRHLDYDYARSQTFTHSVTRVGRILNSVAERERYRDKNRARWSPPPKT